MRATVARHELQATDLRLGRIVRLLMGHATVVVSGTKMAEEIASSRSEVRRLIRQLRGLGVDVAGQPLSGYRLRSVPDLLLPEVLGSLLRGTIFDAHLRHFYKIGSTNTAAMAAAADGAPEGTVFLAEEQMLLDRRFAAAWERGITDFSAETLSSNHDMISVFRHSGTWHPEGWNWSVRYCAPPGSRCRRLR